MARKPPQRRGRSPAIQRITWQLNCDCGKPPNEWTVACQNCSKWYHGECINFPLEKRELVKKLYCKNCTKVFGFKTQFYPKCHLPSCYKPIQQDRYCSLEHGTEFWKNFLATCKDEATLRAAEWFVNHTSASWKTFVTSAPNNMPVLPQPMDDKLVKMKKIIETVKNERQMCGFSSQYLDTFDAKVDDACTADIDCKEHSGWPDMVLKRIDTAALTEGQRKIPHPEWTAQRAKFMVAGTTRFSHFRGKRYAYFVPYVWENNLENYLDGDPDPFFRKYY